VRKCAPYPTSCYLQSNKLEQGMILSSREVALNKFTDVYRFTSADLVEIGNLNTVKVATLPAGGIITNIALFTIKDLESGSVAVRFGDGTSSNYIRATNISTSKCAYSDGVGFTQGGDVGTLNGIVNNTTDDIDVNMTISLMNNPVGGEFLFCANILDPAKIAI
jgi:hypothetical protein